ncbi:hypothetical protein GCM10010232_03870 [Streptomyces amakusaensis]|uniref:Uncharacterized protein n=1 Tax=Streptomyces amakusaensis TaxID=67271 RepID=A0ABW0AM29_9ACTN
MTVLSTVKPDESRFVCAATVRLPLQLVVLALEITPDERGHPMEVATELRCGLEEHADGAHFDLVRELDDASGGEVWTRWEEGQVPEGVAVLADCGADNGRPGGENEACALYRGHGGGHSFEYADPEYEVLLTEELWPG